MVGIGISNAAAINILKLVFQATSWSGYATNDATQTNIGISLHVSPGPTDAGDATSNEVNTTQYQGYTRVNVARTTPGGWSAVATGPPASTSPSAAITFPASTGGSTGTTLTHFATGASNATPPTGAQAILWSGDISPTIVISAGGGVTPQLTTGTTITLT